MTIITYFCYFNRVTVRRFIYHQNHLLLQWHIRPSHPFDTNIRTSKDRSVIRYRSKS